MWIRAIQRPEIIDIAEAIDAAPGVAGLNITVTEIDVQTVGMDITVEGDNINVGALFRAIESTGAVATTRLGRAARRDALADAAQASLASFSGALLPLGVAAALPAFPWLAWPWRSAC
jgi:Uncharacterized ArCR, COG1888